jgi:TetR/AcrR family hemagglutinin/protease transcriptional regulator
MREERARAPRARKRAARLAPAERRAQLLASALAACARRGVGAVRHADVAAAAHVSLPAVFHYFPTRDALVNAVLAEIERLYLDMTLEAAAGADAGDRLRRHAQAFVRSVDTHPDHARVWLDWSTAVGDQVWRRYLRFSERVHAEVEATIRRGRRDGSVASDIEPKDAARLFVAAAYAVVQMKLAGASRAEVERFQRSLVRAVTGRPA